HPLVARAGLVERVVVARVVLNLVRVVDAERDVRRLLVDRDDDAARFRVEAVLRPRVADVLDRVADDLPDVDVRVGRHLAGDDDETGRDERLARDAAVRIVGESGVENRVGDLVRDLVGVALGDRLRGEEEAARHAPESSRYSPVGRRPISDARMSSSDVPSSTLHTPSVIGISTPTRCERSRSTGAVVSPSTTWPICALASSAVAPREISSPARRFRPVGCQHVTTRSPMPASPANVSGSAPSASPSRALPTRPRVISAAFALSPSSRPSTAPAESAITFFAAAQISTPIRSLLTYTRNTSELIASCSQSASASSSDAITVAPGRPASTSSAWLGPDRTATGLSRTRVERRAPLSGSRPLTRLRIGAVPRTWPRASRKERDGTASTTSSASS